MNEEKMKAFVAYFYEVKASHFKLLLFGNVAM